MKGTGEAPTAEECGQHAELVFTRTSQSASQLRKKGRQNAQRRAELELEKFVLGDPDEILETLDKRWQKQPDEQTAAARTASSDDGDEDGSSTVSKRKQVWQDEDDDDDTGKTNVRVLKRTKHGTMVTDVHETTRKAYKTELERRFVQTMGTPSWAKLSSEHDASKVDDADELLKRVGHFIQKPDFLVQDMLDIKIRRDLAQCHTGRKRTVAAVEFHPKSQVALVAQSKGVTLRQVDGGKNAVIQELKLPKFPVTCARFTRDGCRLLASSTVPPYCYVYDMMSGNLQRIKSNRNAGKLNMEKFYLSPDNQFIVSSGISGYIHFLMTKTNEHAFSYKMNSDLRGVAFNEDGSRMYSHSVDGQVYVWDMRQRKCLHSFADDGCIHGTSIALSSSEQYLATGSDTGAVNVYDTAGLSSSLSKSPSPHKTFLNLTTPIAGLKFNSTSELLAMYSADKNAAVRIVHCSSMTVFANFPNNVWNLDKITALDMSLNSGYLILGTNSGFGKLFRLNYYGNY